MNKISVYSLIFNFVLRGIMGVVIISFVNIFLENQDILVAVGLNEATFLTSGILGIPGVALLYGITFFSVL